ncbi:hypothetical protein [Pseudomonas zeae]|uniref:Uncharacterized protein n=1 Tax=Pseudomonas zeae TaxID=2745510 RepID=A0A9E6T8Z1_9PSED|nr:hypothetical protein [Pseudomonas zeae]QXI09159.1 hypothetical protein HU754_014955 [Pseudomonas zeae]
MPSWLSRGNQGQSTAQLPLSLTIKKLGSSAFGDDKSGQGRHVKKEVYFSPSDFAQAKLQARQAYI